MSLSVNCTLEVGAFAPSWSHRRMRLKDGVFNEKENGNKSAGLVAKCISVFKLGGVHMDFGHRCIGRNHTDVDVFWIWLHGRLSSRDVSYVTETSVKSSRADGLRWYISLCWLPKILGASRPGQA